MLALSFRMTWRDWRAGELRFLLVALMIAVAAISSVGFFVDRVHAALIRDANQLLGGDLVIGADFPLDASIRAPLTGLQQAETISFVSMAASGDESLSKLVAVKAVTAAYPLRGRVTFQSPSASSSMASSASSSAAGAAAPAQSSLASTKSSSPVSGTVWVDPVVLTALRVRVGERIKLGDVFFTVAEVIANEPDRGTGFMNLAPRIMMSNSDLAATNLIAPGSRVTYRLLLSGTPERIAEAKTALEQSIETQKLKGIRLETLSSGNPQMRASLDHAEQFLSLVSLLSALLAALAIALAGRRFVLRHLDACAMLRCLGMTQSQVGMLVVIEFCLLGAAGSILGALLGYAGHLVLIAWLGNLVTNDLPLPSLLPGLQAMACGFMLLLGFALPPVFQLRNVPHNRVIRRDTGTPQAHTIAAYGVGLGTSAALFFWITDNAKLTALTLCGFLLGFLLFSVIAWLCIRALWVLKPLFNPLVHGWNAPSWRFAITALQRRPGASVVQVVALALGLMALLLMTVIRADLLSAWEKSIPANSPNQFVINILPEQRAPLVALFQQHQLAVPELYPMIRGRLIAVNQKPVSEKNYTTDTAQRLVNREFNLSTMKTMQSHNHLVEGRWFMRVPQGQAGADAGAATGAGAGMSNGASNDVSNDVGNGMSKNRTSSAEASVEQGIASSLGLKLGDTLRFEVAGQAVDVRISSIRKLDWSSMQVNFFVIINPESASDLPQTWITSFFLPAEQAEVLPELTRRFPNMTVFDTGVLVQQLRDVLAKVAAAVEFLFVFTLACGVLVLYAALQSSQQLRLQEASLLRALGASTKQLARAQWIEYGLVGALAGLLAASGAAVTGWALATRVFDFSFQPSPWLWVAGVVGGCACALLGGWVGLRDILKNPPLLSLRAFA